jgi:hypothetical protein
LAAAGVFGEPFGLAGLRFSVLVVIEVLVSRGEDAAQQVYDHGKNLELFPESRGGGFTTTLDRLAGLSPNSARNALTAAIADACIFAAGWAWSFSPTRAPLRLKIGTVITRPSRSIVRVASSSSAIA